MQERIDAVSVVDRALNRLADADRAGLYRTIFSRRDVRSQFVPDDVPVDVLARVLTAAHHAPSVGLMQPWNFILIRDATRRARVRDLFTAANAEAAALHPGARGAAYRALKLEGIRDCPINVCITCNHDRLGPHVLGRSHIRETDIYSTVCAVQNFWLAARAEGLGVGWVSIVDPEKLAGELGLPNYVTAVAYLCVGYVSTFLTEPELQRAGWEKRLAASQTVKFEGWDNNARGRTDDFERELTTALDALRTDFPASHLAQDDGATEEF
ncbi:MAG: 5,6-dimethylbenzimidazole synthase [Pseudomonadota bacterium]